jgi:hypothetical protein
MGVRGVSWLVLVALTLLTAAPVRAQAGDEASRAEARKIGYAGVEAYQAGDFATARERLETAYQLLRVPSLGLWSGRALAKLGKLVEADARYLEVIRLPTSVGDEAIQEQARRDASNERTALARRIPSILVRVEGAPASEVSVTIDDAAMVGSALGENHLVNPGRHKVEGLRGTTRASVAITVAEGEQREAVLRFAAAPQAVAPSSGPDAALGVQRPAVSTGSDSKRTIGWVTLSAGGAGLVIGAVSALMAMSKKSDLDTAGCSDGRNCPASERGNVDSYNNLRVVSGVGFIAGAALAGVGAYLLLTAPADDAGREPAASRPRPRSGIGNVRLAVLPGGTVLSGEF